MISATVIADSISKQDKRLTTLQLRYPRFIHSELMTHRAFSRNASSSRAIPVKRLIEDLRREPAMPVFWGSNKPGMQAGEELSEQAIRHSKIHWLEAMEEAIKAAESMVDLGLHKQIANRVLEPWAHMNTIVTATEWDNFYELRMHKDAQPEFRELAHCMHTAQASSTPILLAPGEWHTPYVTGEEHEGAYSAPGDNWPAIIKLSVARCARVSYLTHEGKTPDPAEDLKLYERLVGGRPIHASPAEHQATPDEYGPHGTPSAVYGDWNHPEQHGNFVGWRQYRKFIEDSFHDGVSPLV
jgi:hypothetical protein